MGRYYSGDIEGKFWFGIQPSNVGESFGAVEQDQYLIDYVVHREQLDKTHKRMNELIVEMGDNKRKLDDFFKDNTSYSDDKLIANGINPEFISAYADWNFGKKILDFFDQNPDEDYCEFSAEL
jgi:hypothetical protein